MKEISLNVLDIAQNSISAGADLIEISVEQDSRRDLLTVLIRDNGCGMTAQQLEQIRDPFYTTRTTRSIGLGVPLFRMAAEMSGGALEIDSSPGRGTVVKALFGLSHIDRMPLGDICSTMVALIQGNPVIDFVYCQMLDGEQFTLDTRELRAVLEDVSLNTPDVLAWIRECVMQGISSLEHAADN